MADAQSAAKTKGQGKGVKQYILTSTLPSVFRKLPVLAEPTDTTDLTYQGLVAMIVSLIYANNGILPQGISLM
jgi:MAGE family